jgi:hypothetical protein
MVPKLYAETWVTVRVLDPILEDMVTKSFSILKLETEDVLETTTRFLIAESMEDQNKMTSVLKLMLDVQEHHGDHITLDLVKNSESPEKVGLKEEAEAYGDHSPHTTSGIITTVPKLSAET